MKEQSGVVGGQWCCSATGATEVGELCAESEGLHCGNVTQLEDTQLVGGRRGGREQHGEEWRLSPVEHGAARRRGWWGDPRTECRMRRKG